MSMTTNMNKIRHLLVCLEHEVLYAPETIMGFAAKRGLGPHHEDHCFKILCLKTKYLGESHGSVHDMGTTRPAWLGKSWITLTIQDEYASIIKIFGALEANQIYSIWDVTSNSNVLEPRLRPILARAVLLISDGRASYLGCQWQAMASEKLLPTLVKIVLEIFLFSAKGR